VQIYQNFFRNVIAGNIFRYQNYWDFVIGNNFDKFKTAKAVLAFIEIKIIKMKKKILLAVSCFAMISLLYAQDQGGPDAYGYLWKNQNATNGPTYSWIDITSSGTQVTGLKDDNFKGPFNIGFSFQYYWTLPTKFYVGSNGYISFDQGVQISSQGDPAFPSIPTANSENNFVAPFLCDLNFGGAGNVGECYYYTNNVDTLIVSFINVPFWNRNLDYDGSNSFQIILNGADNSITLQYKDQTGSYDPAYDPPETNPIVIGIENITGTVGLEHSNSTLPTPLLAVRYEYPDSVTYAVIDVKPDWLNNAKNGGFFMLKNVTSVFDASITNVGNSNIGSSFICNEKVYTSNNGMPSGAPHYNQDYLIGGLNSGQTSLFSFGPTYTPATAGTFHALTQTTLSSDLINGNDEIETELVVLDTVGMSSVTLSYTVDDTSGRFGFEGAAVYYEPPFYPCDVEKLIFSFINDDNLVASNDIRIRILDDDGPNGDPGTMLFDSSVAGASVVVMNTGGSPHTMVLASPITITSGGFYMVWEITTTPQNTFLYSDTEGPFSLQTYEVLSGAIAPYRSASTQDIYMHATISVPSAPALTKPIADFSANAMAACTNDQISFYNHALTATSYSWTFQSGTPTSSILADPQVSWGSTGTFDVTLIATNGAGSDTITKSVTIYAQPTAAFTQSVDTVEAGSSVTFTNGSSNHTASLWDFGDGNISTADDPSHVFTTVGSYTVTLEASNACGTDQTNKTVVVKEPIGISENGTLDAYRIFIYPNPSNGNIVLSTDGIAIDKIEIFNTVGIAIYTQEISGQSNRPMDIDVSFLQPGIFIMKISKGSDFKISRIAIMR